MPVLAGFSAVHVLGADLNRSESKGATASPVPVLLPRDGTQANSTPHRPFLAYRGGIASPTLETNAAKSNRQLARIIHGGVDFLEVSGD